MSLVGYGIPKLFSLQLITIIIVITFVVVILVI